MRKYTFRSNDTSKDLAVVVAKDEEQARFKAMRVLWGPVTETVPRGFQGDGLLLEKVEDIVE